MIVRNKGSLNIELCECGFVVMFIIVMLVFHIGLNHKKGNSHIASLPCSSVKGSEFAFNLSKQQNYCLTFSPVFGKTAAERRHLVSEYQAFACLIHCV